jgi:DivIVA domain-containing protein
LAAVGGSAPAGRLVNTTVIVVPWRRYSPLLHSLVPRGGVRAVAAGRFAARGARPIWPEVTFWSRLAIDHEVPRGEVGGDGTPVHAYASDEGALMSHDLARDIQLRPTRFRSGYAADEVEPFLAAVQDALRSPRPRLRAGDVAERRFTPVILKPGYRMDDVDDYLTEVEHLLSERAPRG